MNSIERNKKEIIDFYNHIAPERRKWVNKNRYYYDCLAKQLQFLVEPGRRVLLMRADTGMLLDSLKPSFGVGVDYSKMLVEETADVYPNLKFIYSENLIDFTIEEKFDYIVLPHFLDDIYEVQPILSNLQKYATKKTRMVLINHNTLWDVILKLAETLGLKMPQRQLNWLSIPDIENILHLSGFEVVKKNYAMLCPIYIPLVSALLNKIFVHLPLVNRLCLLQILTAKKMAGERRDGTVSVVIPCKNEEGNIADAVARIPAMGLGMEIIFVDDKSTDGTRGEVLKWQMAHPEKNIRLVDGPGICKSEAVWRGFEAATGDILMILDGDLTVMPEELPLFYNAIMDGRGEFVNGSRQVYPMEGEAMRALNILGNKFFSHAFSYLLGQRIKDTLCGTKVMWREDYSRIKNYIGKWGEQDRWGDYDLLFGAAKLNLKIVDLPVHYVERVYGETKMKKRFKNGVIMLKMCWAAFKKFKLSL
jgi:hypothetical protein